MTYILSTQKNAASNLGRFIVRDWVNVDPTRTLSVLDPAWAGVSGNPFQASLARGLRQSNSHANNLDLTPRLHVVRERTADGLSRVLTELPAPEPKEPLALELVQRPGQRLAVRAQNTGSELREVSLSASFQNGLVSIPPGVVKLRLDNEESNFVRRKRPLLRGDFLEFEFISDVPSGATAIEIRAAANNTFGSIHWSTSLAIANDEAA